MTAVHFILNVFSRGWNFNDITEVNFRSQAFINCVHGHDHARHVHANGVTWTRKFKHGMIPLCKNNLNLPIFHSPLCSKKIKITTTTAFLISNTVVPNPYSHIRAFIPHLSHPYLQFHNCLIDLSQPDIQILYGLQIDHGIRQCINSGWTGILKDKFRVHGQNMRFVTPLLISIYQNGSAAM